MIKKISDIVTLFMEDGQVVGMLYENGHRELYSVKRASKEDVAYMLEVDHAEDIHHEN